MSKKYTACVFIGRMQPPTNAHVANIKKALEVADFAIVGFGSAFQPRTIKNPFTFQERATMIRESLGLPFDSTKIDCIAVRDNMYNDTAWAADVQSAVHAAVYTRALLKGIDGPPKIAIIGHKKDSSSFYLDMFPQWDFIEADVMPHVNATDIRVDYFNGAWPTTRMREHLPQPVMDFLSKFQCLADYNRLVDEFEHITAYKKAWSVAPYPPTFLTADAVVVKSAHVLMIKRKAAPGEGLWALPGGFVNQNETIEDAMIRELREETGLKVPVPVIRNSIKQRDVFDHPGRSLRGRTVTQAFFVDLGTGPLDKVKGGDDAAKAKWLTLDEIRTMSDQIFEDHKDIIAKYTGA